MIGFIGLGSMGSAMVENLLDHGVDVLVWNRSKDPLEQLVARGAKRAESAKEILGLEVSLSMLANDAAEEAVLTPENLKLAEGNTHANMASVSPECSKRLNDLFSEHRVGYVASPVLGRPPVARKGALNILAAGNSNDLEKLNGTFDVLGVKTWALGNHPPTANAVKIAVNYNIIHAIQALAESIGLAEAAGLDAPSFVEILGSTLFGGVAYQGYGRQIAHTDYLPQAFSLDLGLKDLLLAKSTAEGAGVILPTAGVLEKLLIEAGSDDELKDLDWAAVAEITLRQFRGAPR